MLSKGYYDLVTIPAGAIHVKIYENPSTTDNFLGKQKNFMEHYFMLCN